MYKEWVRELCRAVTLMGFPESASRIQQAFTVSGYLGALRQWAKELERWAATKQDYSPCTLAEVYTSLGDKDRAFYWLGQGVDQKVSSRSLEVERRFGFILRGPLFERGSFSS